MNLRLRHLLLALAVHVLAFVLMTAGMSCSRKLEPPPVIQAVLVDPSRQEVQERERRRAEQERRRREEEQRRKAEAEKQRLAEAEKKRLAEEEQRRQEAEKKRLAEEQQQRQAEAEKKRQAEEEQRRKAEADKKRVEEEQRRKAEAEKKRAEEARREAEEHRQRELMEEEQRMLQERLAREEEMRLQSERQSALAQWTAEVEDRIRRNWLRPPDFRQNFQCRVRVRILPTGQVLDRRIEQTCGSAVLNESVLRAVDKSDPLPALPASVDQRELIVNFTPNG